MSFTIDSVPAARGPLKTILPVEGTSRFDPFLVFHEQGPVVYRPREALGFDDHPHRGFETITYVVAGEQYHRDSHGHEGVIAAGGMQWMTAASGIIHAELPTPALFENGGAMHAFQIWLNLPKAAKMARPRYQEFPPDRLPTIERPGTWMRLLAGAYDGVRAPVETQPSTFIAHIRLSARADAAFPLEPGATTIVYALGGAAQLGPQPIIAGDVATSRNERSYVAIGAGGTGFEGLVLSALPIGEPVVADGPFVMTTPEDVREAYEDYRAGRFALTPGHV